MTDPGDAPKIEEYLDTVFAPFVGLVKPEGITARRMIKPIMPSIMEKGARGYDTDH